MHKVPVYSKELITVLDKEHPDEYPTDKAVDAEFWKEAGKVELIRELKALAKKQQLYIKEK